MKVIGIDPGLAILGWGILEKKSADLIQTQDSGAINTPGTMSFPLRLGMIYQSVRELINLYNPKVMSIETLFYARNIKSLVTLSHVRGTILLAAVEAGLEIAEYSPLQIKLALTGYGQASKLQIQKMVKLILNLKQIPKPDDVADALAVGICYLQSNPVLSGKS